MAFTRVGTVVIQSGIDTTLSGIEAISGVAKFGGLYFFNGVTLRVDGNLSFNGTDEQIKFVNTPDGGTGVNFASLYINNGSTLNVSCTMGDRSSFSAIPSLFPCIDFGTRNIPTVGGTNTRYNDGRKFISGHPNSTITLEGLYVGANSNTSGVLTAMEGTTTLNNAIIAFNTALANNQFSFINYAEFNNSTLQGGSLTDRNAQLVFNGFAVKESSEGILLGGNTAGAKTAVVVDYDPQNVVTDLRINMIGSTTNGAFILLNSAKDVNQTTYNFNDSSGFGAVLFKSILNMEFKDSLGGSAEVSVYGKDNNSGKRNGIITLPDFPSVDSDQDFVYQGTAIGGLISFEVVTGIATELNNLVNKDDRGLVTFKFVSYSSIIATSTPNLIGLGDKKVISTTLPDSLITEPSKLNALAYLQQDNAFKAYDHLKALLVDNYDGQDETFVTRSDNALNARSLDVVINNTGSGAATIIGNTLTLNASEFTGNITTTGTVTGSEFVNGLISDSTGTNNLIAITNLTDSNVQIINSLNQVLDRQENVSGDYSYATDIGVSGAHKIIINRLGYSANVIDVNLQGQSYSFNGSLNQNLTPSGAPMYSGSGAGLLSFQLSNEGDFYRLAIFNNSVTAQNVYDQSENFLMIEAGMSHLANGGGNVTFASLPTGNFLFLGDNVQLLRALPEDDSATVEAFVTSTQGTVLDSSNGSVQFVTVTRAQQLTEYSGFIWVDLINGVDENQYPAGTPSRPTNSIQNAKVLADFFGINSVKISGDQTALPQKLSGLSLISDTSQAANSVLLPTLIFIELADLNNCVIDSFALTGSFNVSTDVIGNEYKECLIHNVNGLTGFARKCKISGAIQVEQSLDLVDCYGSFFLLASGSNSNVTIPSYSGFVTIAGMTSSDATISMSLTSGTVTIDESCTSGSILIFTDNDKFVIDNSSGATVTVLASELSGGNGQGGQQITPADIWGYDLSLITSSNTAASEIKDAKQNTINILNDVQQIPTTPLLSADYVEPDNAGIQAIKAKTDTLQNTDLSLIAEKTDIQNQTNDLKGAANKDLTEVFNNTPDVNLTPVLDAVNGLNDFDPSVDAVARVSLVDETSALTGYVEPDNAGIDAIRSDTGQINQIAGLLQLIKKYHDNKTEFLNENKTQKVTQQNAHHIVIYDDDGITPIKEISFLDSSGNSSNLINAAEYVKL